MQNENGLMVYEGDVNFEKYESKCVKANKYMADIRKDMRSEKPIYSEFLTVKAFSKNLKFI